MTNYFPQLQRSSFWRWSCGLLLALLLTACDDGGDAEPAVATPPATPPASSVDSGTTPPASNPTLAVASISTTLYSPDGKLLSGSTVDVGDIVTFHAAFSGSEPSSYQWYRNGVAIEDANADSYELGQFSSIDDQALFSVRVSSADNSTGTLSQPVSLTVRPGNGIDLLAGWLGGPGGANGFGATARFDRPKALTIDAAGNLYALESEADVIRKITPSGVVTTIRLPVHDSGMPLAFKPHTITPQYISSDRSGNLYVAYYFDVIKVGPLGVVGTRGVIGDWLTKYTPPISGVSNDAAGNLYVASGNAILKIGVEGDISTLAGQVNEEGSSDGAGSVARFSSPTVQACDAGGNIYLSDKGNSVIRKINALGVVSTLHGIAEKITQIAGTASSTPVKLATITVDESGNLYASASNISGVFKITPAGAMGQQPGTNSNNKGGDANVPTSVFAVNASGTIYTADRYAIRKITHTGAVSTLAGRDHKGGLEPGGGSKDGIGTAARFGYPWAIATDRQGNAYVTDEDMHTVRKITADGIATTLAGKAGQPGYQDGNGANATFQKPKGIATDAAGNVYVADSGNSVIRKITPAGIVSTLAGRAGSEGDSDGTGDAARFNAPAGLASDAAGNLYVAEDSGAIRKITPGGQVSTRATLTSLDPQSLASDASGNLYILQYSSPGPILIKLTLTGEVIKLGGVAYNQGGLEGWASGVYLGETSGITLDPDGNLYLARGNIVSKLTPGGMVSTIAGSGSGVRLGALPGGFSRALSIAFGYRHSRPVLFVVNNANRWSRETSSYRPSETNIVTIALP